METVVRIVAAVGWALLAVGVLYVGVRIYDLFDPIDYQSEIQDGNVAAAIVIGCVTLALAGIVIVTIAI